MNTITGTHKASFALYRTVGVTFLLCRVNLLGYGDFCPTFLHDSFQSIATLSWNYGRRRRIRVSTNS